MTLFFDVNVGTVVPRVLKDQMRLPVEYHVLHFPIDLPDDEWLPQVGTWGWTVIGHDQNFHIYPNELSAIKQYEIGCFYLWGGQATRWEKLRCFARAYDRILEADTKTTRPFIFRVTQAGTLRSVPIP